MISLSIALACLGHHIGTWRFIGTRNRRSQAITPTYQMTVSTKRIAHQPREIADCVSAYLQEGDLEGIASMFHPDCKIFFPPDQPPSTGIAGARAAFEGFMEIRPRIKTDVFSEVIIGDIALLRANWSVIAPDGTVMTQGQSTEVAKKLENGGWGYLIDCPNGPPNHS